MTSRHPAVSCACPKCQSERRTTPPPATEEREAAFNAAIIGLNWDKNPALVANARQLFGNSLNNSCGALSDYMAGRFIDAFRAADAALSALAPIRAAEILAAEASERARIVASLRATSTGLDLTNRRIADAIERNEHGAGK